jgi:dipeptidyl aminopeptidase/acylaminoacyl peptidase
MMSYDDLAARPAPRATMRLRYGPGPLHFGDLWVSATSPSAAPTDRTTIVLIHGGCWESEYDLGHAAYAAAALAELGYAVWVPEYRRLGDDGGGWPGTFDDVAAAVDFVPALAEREPRVGAGRVILAGHSAGAQLALWAAARRDVAGVVSLAGITDLAVYGAAAGDCNASVARLVGGGPSEVPERYRAVSPIELLPIGVRLALVHGELDSIVPVAQTENFARRAAASGDEVDVTVITDAGHFELMAPESAAWPRVAGAFTGISPPS